MDDSDDETGAAYFLPGGIADDGPPRRVVDKTPAHSFRARPAATFGNIQPMRPQNLHAGYRMPEPSNSLLSGLGGEAMPVQNRERGIPFSGFGYGGSGPIGMGSIGVIGSASTQSPSFGRPTGPSYLSHAPSMIASPVANPAPLRAPPGLAGPAQGAPTLERHRSDTQPFGGFMSHMRSPTAVPSPLHSTPHVAMYRSDSNTSNSDLAELNTTSVVVSHSVATVDPKNVAASPQLFGPRRVRPEGRASDEPLETPVKKPLARTTDRKPPTKDIVPPSLRATVDSPSSASSGSSKESSSPPPQHPSRPPALPAASTPRAKQQRSPLRKAPVQEAPTTSVAPKATKPERPVTRQPPRVTTQPRPTIAAPEPAPISTTRRATQRERVGKDAKPLVVVPSTPPRAKPSTRDTVVMSPQARQEKKPAPQTPVRATAPAPSTPKRAPSTPVRATTPKVATPVKVVEPQVDEDDDVVSETATPDEAVVPADESNEESCEDESQVPTTDDDLDTRARTVSDDMHATKPTPESEEESKPAKARAKEHAKRAEKLRKEQSRKERKLQQAKKRDVDEPGVVAPPDDLADYAHSPSVKVYLQGLCVTYLRWLAALVLHVQAIASVALSVCMLLGLHLASYALSFHRLALRGLLVNRNIGSCFAFLYLFPLLVQYVIPWAPPWAPVCLWYAFLVQLFCTQGSTAMVATFRILLPLVFLVEGVSHHSFLLDLNGAELLLISFILSALKTGNMCSPVFFLSLSVQCLSAVFLGSELFVQWGQLAIALYSLNAMSSLHQDWSLLEGGEESGHRHFIGEYHQPATGPLGASIQKTKRLDRRSLASVVKGRNKARGNSSL
ncbi:hypothetical protein SDRG_06363 [Saprolegnia diclina VS20]|uniref:Uncharacterized protein n=1 Tax=Saprolegnia diclina (strain VS20) TaxID=1156394 RepID=T0RUV3_SAPDV|nr:hypothetical protein SDRG_06363 [Saprolegnia diclina VS20]EQC36258.1 hypothetical protein SDRG_06363 [Saprolegnia diclina VS20]|eukprot:XP_008610364.1 hypothetical protein SDRG_06363 [Saprolegnia diclina VS20]